jgi:cell division protein FtsB
MSAMGRNTIDLIRRAALPAFALLTIAYFLGYAIVGANGILSWGDYRRLKSERLVQLAQLDREKVRLAHRADLLDPRGADPDLTDEMVRAQLGLVRPDEVIINIKE